MGLGVGLSVALFRASKEREVSAGAHWRVSSTLGSDAAEGTLPRFAWLEPPGNYFFHSAQTESPTLTVDLGQVRRVTRIEIENRKDCCRERSNSLIVEGGLDENHWVTLGDGAPGAFDKYSPKFAPLPARFIRLSLRHAEYFHLSALRVFGK
jgi:hypothetical protein